MTDERLEEIRVLAQRAAQDAGPDSVAGDCLELLAEVDRLRAFRGAAEEALRYARNYFVDTGVSALEDIDDALALLEER